MTDATPEYCRESQRRAQAGLPIELTPYKKPSITMTDGQTEVHRQIAGERFQGRRIQPQPVRPAPSSECLLAIRPLGHSYAWKWVLYDGCQIVAEGVPHFSEKGAHDDAEWMFEHIFYQSRIRRETRNHKPSEIAVMSDKELTVREKMGAVRDLLRKAEPEIARALPKHLTPDRMLRVVETCVQRTPTLLDCTPISLIGAVVEASQLALELGGHLGQAYLVPFNNKKTRRKEVQLIIGYKGLENLAYRSDKVLAINAAAVYAADEYRYTEGLHPILEHTPSATAEKGDVVAAYAVATMIGDVPCHAWLWRVDIDKIRANAQSSDSPAWTHHFPEMAKKTAIRRLCKSLPVAVVQRATELMTQAEQGLPQRFASQIDFAPTTDVLDIASEPSALDAAPEDSSETQSVSLTPTPKAEPPVEPEPEPEVDQQEESTKLCKALVARVENPKTTKSKAAIMKLERQSHDYKADGRLYPGDYDIVMEACLSRRTELAAAE